MSRALVTGASSGIGRAAALHLAAEGHEVIAAARRVEPLQRLASANPQITALSLDVTDAASIGRAFASIGNKPIDILINAASYAEIGPVEVVAAARVASQFDTNVIGVVRMVQAVLPGMRARGRGRIVNVSSVAGRIAFPFMGVYCASKFALEGLSDSLRLELRTFGIDVVLVEPGAVATEFNDVAARHAAADSPAASAWAGVFDPTRLAAATEARAISAELIARAIADVATMPTPPARIAAPARAKRLLTLARWLPTARMDQLIRARASL